MWPSFPAAAVVFVRKARCSVPTGGSVLFVRRLLGYLCSRAIGYVRRMIGGTGGRAVVRAEGGMCWERHAASSCLWYTECALKFQPHFLPDDLILSQRYSGFDNLFVIPRDECVPCVAP